MPVTRWFAHVIKIPRRHPIRVDLSGVTGIDGAARYLLQLMRVRNVSLVGACLAIRASLDDDATPTPGQS
jgi:hypothetical protein